MQNLKPWVKLSITGNKLDMRERYTDVEIDAWSYLGYWRKKYNGMYSIGTMLN